MSTPILNWLAKLKSPEKFPLLLFNERPPKFAKKITFRDGV